MHSKNNPMTLALMLCLSACLLAASCTVGPVITANSVSLGGTLMTKSKGYYARYDGPLGKIETGTAETDETVIPGKVANYYGIKAATDGAVALLKTKETTTRVLAREETSRAAAQSAASVEKARIAATPLEEAAETVPALAPAPVP